MDQTIIEHPQIRVELLKAEELDRLTTKGFQPCVDEGFTLRK